jgi:hypothetical protein
MGDPFFGPEHVNRYRGTDGEEGHHWQATTVLLLTTGRNSNAKRTTPLIYHADDYLVVASNGGDPPGSFVTFKSASTTGFAGLLGVVCLAVCRPRVLGGCR